MAGTTRLLDTKNHEPRENIPPSIKEVVDAASGVLGGKQSSPTSAAVGFISRLAACCVLDDAAFVDEDSGVAGKLMVGSKERSPKLFTCQTEL